MSLRNIIREEISDFDWVKEIKLIPNEILNIDKYPPGDYKVWLGNIPKEQQLMILDHIIGVIEGNDDLHISTSVYSIRDGIKKDDGYPNSLYFDIYPPGTAYEKKSIIVAMMAWYPKQEEDKDEVIERCRDYFDNHRDTVLNTVKPKE